MCKLIAEVSCLNTRCAVLSIYLSFFQQYLLTYNLLLIAWLRNETRLDDEKRPEVETRPGVETRPEVEIRPEVETRP